MDGTQIAIKGLFEDDPRFTKAAYWCRKNYYALNAMIVSIEFLQSARNLIDMETCQYLLRSMQVMNILGSITPAHLWLGAIFIAA